MSDKRKIPRRKSLHSQGEVILRPEGGGTELRAKLLNISDTGMGVELAGPLVIGSFLTILGELQNMLGRAPIQKRARVCWCCAVPPKYHVGIKFDDVTNQTPIGDSGELLDYYDVMQLSPKADSETIQRVFRMLAQRYHPDNQETGKESTFREVLEAYKVLSDPEQRAAYDAVYEKNRRERFKVFEGWQAVRGIEAERRKRHGILSLLYAKRAGDPHQPTISIRECEEMLGCPRDHLEFCLWYLKESGLIYRSDNNRFQITIQGVNEFESQAAPRAVDERPRLVPAVKS